MNKEILVQEKKQLEESKEQAIAQLNQITGAIAMTDKLMADMDAKELENSKPVDETPKDKKATK